MVNNKTAMQSNNPTSKRLWYLLLAVCAILVVLDFVIDRHPHFPIEEIPAFFALFGFIAFVGVVFGCALFGRFVRRAEDYYDPKPDRSSGDGHA